jgi:hypothetical protein
MSYYEINQEKRLKYQNEYYQINKDKINERQKIYFKKYYWDHRNEMIERNKRYNKQISIMKKLRKQKSDLASPDPFKNINYIRLWILPSNREEYHKQYYLNNINKIKERQKQYYLNNIDKIKKYCDEYNKKQYLNKKLEEQNKLNKIIQDELYIKKSCIIDFEEYNNEFYI